MKGRRTSADVETEVHLLLVLLNAVVVRFDVSVKQFIGSLGVGLVLLPTFEHLLGTEVYDCQLESDISKGRSRTSKVWVIKLHVPDSSSVQNVQLGPDSQSNIHEILIVAGVHILWESEAVLVSQVIPRWSNHSNLDLAPLCLRNKSLQVLELTDQGALALVTNLASAYT